MAGAFLAIGLCSGHPLPSFRGACPRQRGDSNRAGTPGKLTPNAVAASEFLSRRPRRPLEFAAGLASSMVRPHPELLTMPLHFSDEELDLLLELCRPIEPARRSAFLDAVAAAIGEQASGRASFTRPRGGSSGSFGRRRSWPTRHPCTAATRPEGLGERLARPRPHVVGLPRPYPVDRVRAMRPPRSPAWLAKAVTPSVIVINCKTYG